MKKTLLNELKKDLLLLGLATTAFNFNNVKASSISEEENNCSIVRNFFDIDLENATDLVSYYSKVYGITEESIFDTFEYETSCYNDMDNTNLELEILNIVRDMYYNHPFDDIKTNTEYEPTKSPEELIEKYCDIFGVNKNIALAICYNECGIDVNSHNFRKNHNPAGIGPHKYFENYEVGIIFYIAMLKNDYKCGLNSDKSFFNKVGNTYCPGTASSWANACSSFYNQIVDDYYYYKPEIKEAKEKQEKYKQKVKSY